jgi:hypothetical protein
MTRFLSRLAILAAAFAACVSGASAQTTLCNGTLAPGTYTEVIVPANATCTVSGTVTVTGNLIVEQGAFFSSNSTGTFIIDGSLLAVNAGNINIGAFDQGSAVDILGNVHLFGTTAAGPHAGIRLNGISIGGNLFISKSNLSLVAAPFDGWAVFGNTIGGNVQLRDNTFTGTLFAPFGANTIGGSLICVGNTPNALHEDNQPNSVGGEKLGQCAR